MANAANLRLEQRQRHVRNLLCKAKNGLNPGMTIKITLLQEITPKNQYQSQGYHFGISIIPTTHQSYLGTKIHATINSSIVCDFDTLIKENDYQIISNFNVKRNVDSTKLTKHEFKIKFYKKTNVRNCSRFNCNDDGTNLISFNDFVEAKID